jgi:hypothetical protein
MYAPIQIPNFNGLALNSRATAQVPSYDQSLLNVDLNFGGGLTKANITELVLKIGAKAVFGPISCTDLDRINSYKGFPASAQFISLYLMERDALSRPLKELGGIDLPSLGGEAVFLEVLNTLASGGPPTLAGVLNYGARQFVDANKDGVNDRRGQLMHKVLRYSLPNTGTRYVWQPVFGGAQIKRVFFAYAGTDWTSSADGNLLRVECKLNGRVVFDKPSCLLNRFGQSREGKTPQSRMYVVDFMGHNVVESALNTANARSLEFILDLTASDNVTAYVEMLDVPSNN